MVKARQTGVYNPTRLEIDKATEKIRQTWNDATRKRRLVFNDLEPCLPPFIRTRPNRKPLIRHNV